MRKTLVTTSLLSGLLLSLPATLSAAPGTDAIDPLLQKTRELDEKTQALKKEIMNLGRDLAQLAWVGGVRQQDHRGHMALSQEMLAVGSTLSRLEDGLLAPPGIQVVVFVSMNTPDDFVLEKMDLQLDKQRIQSRPYSQDENRTLNRTNTTHRLWMGNVPEGKHTLNVTMYGLKDGKPYQDTAAVRFRKKEDRKTLEIRVVGVVGKPRMRIEEWD